MSKAPLKSTILFLLSSSLLILILRLPYTSVPFLTIDETGFAAVANKMVDGHALYKEACDNKPPFIFFFYAGVFSLFGRGNMFAVHITTLFFVLLGLFFLHLLSSEIFCEKVARVATASYALYLVASSPANVFASNTEIYMVPMIVAGIYLCLAGIRVNTTWHWAAAGFCFGMAGWVKQPGILFCLLVPVAALLDGYPFKWPSLCKIVRRCFWGFAGFCTISLSGLCVLWQQGILHDFWDMVILYNTRVQVGSIPFRQSLQMAAYTASVHFKTYFAAILFALTGLGFLIAKLRNRQTPNENQRSTNVSPQTPYSCSAG
jgi:hypothetical protein